MILHYAVFEIRKQLRSFVALCITLVVILLCVGCGAVLNEAGITNSIGLAVDSTLLILPLGICFLAAQSATTLLDPSQRLVEDLLPISPLSRLLSLFAAGLLQGLLIVAVLFVARHFWSDRVLEILNVKTGYYVLLMFLLYLHAFWLVLAFHQVLIGSFLALLVLAVHVSLGFYISKSHLNEMFAPLAAAAVVVFLLLLWIAPAKIRGDRIRLRSFFCALVLVATFLFVPLSHLPAFYESCQVLHPIVGMKGIVNPRLMVTRKNGGYFMATISGDVYRVLQDGSRHRFYKSKKTSLHVLYYALTIEDRNLLSYFYPFRAVLEDREGGEWYRLATDYSSHRYEIWRTSENSHRLMESFVSPGIIPGAFFQHTNHTYLMGWDQQNTGYYAELATGLSVEWQRRPEHHFVQFDGGNISADGLSVSMGEQQWNLPGRATRISARDSGTPGAVAIDESNTLMVPIIRTNDETALAICFSNGAVLPVDIPFLEKDRRPWLQRKLIPGGGVIVQDHKDNSFVLDAKGRPFPAFQWTDIVRQVELPGLTSERFLYECLYMQDTMLYVFYEKVLFQIDLTNGKASRIAVNVEFPQARPEGIYFVQNGTIFLRTTSTLLNLGPARL